MKCDEVRPLIDASVDRELSAADEWRVREHLSGCAQCRRDAQTVQAMSKAVKSADYYRAPAGLGARIIAALPPVVAGQGARAGEIVEEPERGRARKTGWSAWPWPRFGGFGGFSGAGGQAAGFSWFAGALLVLCALGFAAALNLRRPATGGEFVNELVASHVRAQISGRDLDVISTDKHTVKPWFNGKIDYAPPVEDLAAEGFPLAGGRLDYVGRERVAVLVYHYRKHVIDLYVFPPGEAGPAATAGPPPRISEGYALARWQAGGMTWWAVTDAGPEALTGLRAALDARLGGA
ncbi:anti-sigma factor family protein [Paraburkholderia denitrificans]|uniref:Anti-sigma factor family protein n=1 Tax=Paraburkholderia denitrificans TaxID=694025 RepID=A0ABW0J564_9BURK